MSDLNKDVVEQIAKRGYCYTNEAKALAEEVLRRRAEKPAEAPAVPLGYGYWAGTP